MLSEIGSRRAFPSFPAPERQHPGLQIDIGDVERDRLADPEAGDGDATRTRSSTVSARMPLIEGSSAAASTMRRISSSL